MKMLVLPLSRLLTSQAGGKSILGPLRRFLSIPPPDYEQINEAASSGSQVSRSYMPQLTIPIPSVPIPIGDDTEDEDEDLIIFHQVHQQEI